MPFLWTKNGLNWILNHAVLDTVLTTAHIGLDTSGLPFDWERVFADMVPPTSGYTPVDLSTETQLGPFSDAVKQNVYFKYAALTFLNAGSADFDVSAVYLYITSPANLLLGMWVPDNPIPWSQGSTLLLNALIGGGQPAEEFTSELDLP